MKRCGILSLLCVWLLIHPYYDMPDTWRLTKLWNAVRHRNTWVAARIYETKAACEAKVEEARSRVIHEFAKQTPWRELVHLSAFSNGKCISSDLAVPSGVKVNLGNRFFGNPYGD